MPRPLLWSRALIVLATGFVFTAPSAHSSRLDLPRCIRPERIAQCRNQHHGLACDFTATGVPGHNRTLRLSQIRRTTSPREPSVTPIIAGIAAAGAAAVAVTIVTTVGHDLLPDYYADRSVLIYGSALRVQSATALAFFVAGIMLFRKRSSVLDLWLLVAVAGWLIETLLILTLHGRFTVGFYTLYAIVLFTHLIVMLALIAETNRLYARLALSTGLRREERDARLMSMEAVAAAISHEVGQPISASNLSVWAAVDWLMRRPPDVRKAITCFILRSIPAIAPSTS